MIYTIYPRVVAWNAARYERKYNHELAIALLREEMIEWEEAEEVVDTLDALCDIIYVALGVLWKLNLTEAELSNVLNTGTKQAETLISQNNATPGKLMGYMLGELISSDHAPISITIVKIITLAHSEMKDMGLSNKDTMDAMNVVCDANDSKTVQKVASNIKANIDKGPNFVPPEAKLQEILNRTAPEQAVKGKSGAETIALRESVYGPFAVHARAEQAIKTVVMTQPGWVLLNNVQKSAMEMIIHKMARILNDSADYDDNWHDIAGYATLAEQDIKNRK